jgi:hypothetical protein
LPDNLPATGVGVGVAFVPPNHPATSTITTNNDIALTRNLFIDIQFPPKYFIECEFHTLYLG